ncbi:uncharacterized protein LOC124394255 [Silurus meridionalis]|uniref:uncharacterized protein LOC124394255 n=1 Tax=Silurus meridionalis TaxID=175797 RepID=UPI001EEA9F1A|nr:uncharacterized protein LOC124394255 [Silurus meridionalis]
MNLFCFSLEGSMDSLYERVKDDGETHVYTVPNRSSSSTDLHNHHSAHCTRAMSLDMSQISSTHSKKKSRQLPNSMSESVALVGSVKQPYFCSMNEKEHHMISTQGHIDISVQICSRENSLHRDWNLLHLSDSDVCQKSFQKNGINPRSKGGVSSGGAHSLNPCCSEAGMCRSTEIVISQSEIEDAPEITKTRHDGHETRASARENAKSQSWRCWTAGDGQTSPQSQGNSRLSMRQRPIDELWSNAPAWRPNQHVCHQLLTEYHSQDFTLKSTHDGRVSSHAGMVRSITSVDLSVTDVGAEVEKGIKYSTHAKVRSSSFKSDFN